MATKSRSWPWTTLDLPGPSAETRDVRRAYAVRLKALSPEDVTGFEDLRRAYEAALARCRKKPAATPTGTAPTVGDVEGHAPIQTASDGQDTPSMAPAPAVPRGDPSTSAPATQNKAPRKDVANAAAPYVAPAGAWDNEAATCASQAEYLRQMQEMLNRSNFSVARWEPFFDSVLLQDPGFFREVERIIVSQLRTGALDLPAAWNRQADAVFGWSTDGVGFTRRYPFAGGFLAQVTADKPNPAAPSPKKRAISPTVFWLFVVPVLAVLVKRSQTSEFDQVTWIILAIVCLTMALPTVAAVFLLGYAVVSFGLGALGKYRPDLADKRFAMKRAVWDSKSYPLRWKLVLIAAVIIVWIIYMMIVFGGP